MPDLGIDPRKDSNPDIQKLHKEQKFYETKARITALNRSILTLERDIESKQEQVKSTKKEINRLESTLEEVTEDG